jgi:hypothetical protein
VAADEPVPAGLPGLTADALLAGPLGRDLCVNLLDDRMAVPRRRVRRAWLRALDAAGSGDAERCARKLAECAIIADLAGIPFDGSALMVGLVAAVDFARYWQKPDAEDHGFAGEAARAALRPVAEAVAAAAVRDVAWWTEPADRSRQRCTQFLDQHPQAEPQLTGAAGLARAWLAGTCEEEQSAHDRPEDPAAPYSGWWWSSPAHSGLPVTTRGLPRLGAAGLALVEDGLGSQRARCWPVAPRAGARVYEIGGPGQWAALVDRYPLEVTRSRRHDWWRATGQARRWLIPDYAAVAADWDAIHVSVAGYLTTAGLPVPAGGAHTMLAGWDPDATWWLTDVLTRTSPPEEWRQDNHAPFRWTQTRQA